MSERSVGLGSVNPKRKFTHNGKNYEIVSVLTEGALNSIERAMYDEARESLMQSRDMYDPDEFKQERDKLRKAYESGEYSFTNPEVSAKFDTKSGALLFLTHTVTDEHGKPISVPTAFELMVHKEQELEELITEIYADSFPAPKQ